MEKHFRYLVYVLKHKWFVFIECCHRRQLWLGLTHDLSKFRPSEWFPYVNYFYGKGAAKRQPWESNPAFDVAWLHHQHRNKHHWQYWLQVTRKKKINALQIPIKYAEEMLADWIGAAKAKGQGGVYTVEWYAQHKDTIILEASSQRWVENAVSRLEEEGDK